MKADFASLQQYRAGILSTSQMKEACIEKLQGVVAEFQKVSSWLPLSWDLS